MYILENPLPCKHEIDLSNAETEGFNCLDVSLVQTFLQIKLFSRWNCNTKCRVACDRGLRLSPLYRYIISSIIFLIKQANLARLLLIMVTSGLLQVSPQVTFASHVLFPCRLSYVYITIDMVLKKGGTVAHSLICHNI